MNTKTIVRKAVSLVRSTPQPVRQRFTDKDRSRVGFALRLARDLAGTKLRTADEIEEALERLENCGVNLTQPSGAWLVQQARTLRHYYEGGQDYRSYAQGLADHLKGLYAVVRRDTEEV